MSVDLFYILLLAKFLPAREHHTGAKLNFTGSCWLMICVTALLVALLQADALGYWLLEFLLLALLAGWQLKQHEQRAAALLFPLAIWRSRLVVVGNAGNLIIGTTMMGISAFLPTGCLFAHRR